MGVFPLNPLLKKNDLVAREKLSEKYQGLVFRDIDNADKLLYTVSSGHMEYEKDGKVGWTVLDEPSDYDVTALDCLEPFQINKYTLTRTKTKKPTANNMHLIYRNRNRNASESEEDD